MAPRDFMLHRALRLRERPIPASEGEIQAWRTEVLTFLGEQIDTSVNSLSLAIHRLSSGATSGAHVREVLIADVLSVWVACALALHDSCNTELIENVIRVEDIEDLMRVKFAPHRLEAVLPSQGRAS